MIPAASAPTMTRVEEILARARHKRAQIAVGEGTVDELAAATFSLIESPIEKMQAFREEQEAKGLAEETLQLVARMTPLVDRMKEAAEERRARVEPETPVEPVLLKMRSFANARR